MAGFVALRLAPSPRRSSFGILLDVAQMNGKLGQACGSCVTVAQSALRVVTLAATAHFESPTATRGLFSEVGAGVSRLSLTSYGLSSTTAVLLAGVGAFTRLHNVPLRLGLEYHLYLSDFASNADLSPTQSARVRMSVWRR